MRILDNRFFTEQALSAIVEVSRDFCLVGYPYIKKEKPLYKPRHIDNRREAASGLAKLCRGLILDKLSTLDNSRQSLGSGGFCCFLVKISRFITYRWYISNNRASFCVEVGHG